MNSSINLKRRRIIFINFLFSVHTHNYLIIRCKIIGLASMLTFEGITSKVSNQMSPILAKDSRKLWHIDMYSYNLYSEQFIRGCTICWRFFFLRHTVHHAPMTGKPRLAGNMRSKWICTQTMLTCHVTKEKIMTTLDVPKCQTWGALNVSELRAIPIQYYDIALWCVFCFVLFVCFFFAESMKITSSMMNLLFMQSTQHSFSRYDFKKNSLMKRLLLINNILLNAFVDLLQWLPLKLRLSLPQNGSLCIAYSYQLYDIIVWSFWHLQDTYIWRKIGLWVQKWPTANHSTKQVSLSWVPKSFHNHVVCWFTCIKDLNNTWTMENLYTTFLDTNCSHRQFKCSLVKHLTKYFNCSHKGQIDFQST